VTFRALRSASHSSVTRFQLSLERAVAALERALIRGSAEDTDAEGVGAVTSLVEYVELLTRTLSSCGALAVRTQCENEPLESIGCSNGGSSLVLLHWNAH
jgi:hypothetical protein